MSEYPDDIIGAARFALMGHCIQVDFGAERKERMVEDIARVLLLEREAKSEWNFDIDAAPRGKRVSRRVKTADGDRLIDQFEPDILLMASVCGKVLRSYWVPATNHHDGYWAGFAQKGGTPPVAWMPWPAHPTPSKPKQVEAAQS